MVSKEMEKLIIQLKKNKGDNYKPSVNGYRESFDQLAKLIKIPKDARCEPINVEGIPAEWISVPETLNNSVILYFHGGGYVAGSINSHRGLGVRLARTSKSRVILIDYRLAPEYPFPAALEDAVKVYQWLIFSEGIKPEKVIIAGESAGGGLTISTLLKLKKEKFNLPAAGICLSPYIDLAVTGESVNIKADIDPQVTKEDLLFCASQYLGDENPKNPYASPLYADLQGLPPIFIQVGSSEVLLDDSIRLADHAKSSSIEVSLEIWDDMIHMFQLYAYRIPEGQEAINKIGMFIQRILK
ncbi:MAG: alpha/beta hydrolase [Candidatus Odinarchaeota archaeon]